jgi:purine-binding chemotaxis protein CheW
MTNVQATRTERGIDWADLRARLERVGRGDGAGPERAQALLAERRRALAARRDASAGEESVSILVCRSGEERFGFHLRAVAEVVPMPALTRLPRAPAPLHGLMNLHGTACRVADIALLLGLPAAPPRFVVILRQEDPLGLAVEGVERIAEIPAGVFAAAGCTHTGSRRIDGITLLDPDALAQHVVSNRKPS